MSAESILDQYGDKQGWNDASKLEICQDYIDNQQSEDAFKDFVAERAEGEGTNDFGAPYELTANQKLFCRDAEEQNYDVDFGYSGRGMYGKTCPSVGLHGDDEFFTKASYNEDGLGRGVIFYAQY